MAYYNPGRYWCKVTSQGFNKSKEKGTPFFFLAIKPYEIFVTEEECEPVDGNYERKIDLYITDKTIENVVGKLRAMGWTGDDFRDLEPANPDGHSFVGKEIVVHCKHEQVGDKVYDKWELPGTGGGPDIDNDPNVSRTLNAMFGKALKGNGNAPKKAKPPVKETVPTDVQMDEDQIPF